MTFNPQPIAKLSVMVDKVSGEILGYGFTQMVPSSTELSVQVNGELAKTIQLYDDQNRKQIMWDFDSSGIVSILQANRSRAQVSQAVTTASWSTMTQDEKLNYLAKQMGVISASAQLNYH
jgi:hypothetical protein